MNHWTRISSSICSTRLLIKVLHNKIITRVVRLGMPMRTIQLHSTIPSHMHSCAIPIANNWYTLPRNIMCIRSSLTLNK